MFQTVINAFKIKDIRKRLLFTFICLIVVRLGSQVATPGLDHARVREQMKYFMESLGALSMFTGGSLENVSIFALGISPYITASIIMQLLTIAIPRLAEMQKDGETGRKKISQISRFVTVGLAVIEGTAMTINFSNSNLIEGNTFISGVLVVAALTAGSAFLMWLGENITEYGIGNGISIILLINIVAGLPASFTMLYQTFVSGKKLPVAILVSLAIIAIVLVTLVLVILLQDAERKIAVQYSKKMQGNRLVGGNSSFIPIKVNTAGVMPVIFSISIFQFPIVICAFFGIRGDNSASASFGRKLLYGCQTNHWFNFTKKDFIYTLGVLVYIALNIVFAYFYTNITFNPVEIANNMKKDGGFIPGIRPGKPTTDYLEKVLDYIILIGAVGLTIVALIPIFFTGYFGIQLGFGGTSLIIIVGVVLETIKQVESMMLVRRYKGFLND